MRYLLSIIGASLAIAAAHAQVNDGGYYKSSTGMRIYTFELKGAADEVAVRRHAARLPYTQGRITAAYYYPAGSRMPRDGVSLAGSVFKANDVLYEMPGLSSWRFASMRGVDGSTAFVDCQAKPDDSLCRR